MLVSGCVHPTAGAGPYRSLELHCESVMRPVRVMRFPLLVATLALCAAITTTLASQVIPPGSVLRVKLKGDPQTVLFGTLVRVQRDTVSLRPRYDPAATLTTVPLANVAGVDISQGTHGHAKTGAFIGGGLGALTGAVIFAGYRDMFGLASESEKAGAALLGGVVCGAGGAAVGALVGSVIRSEGWKSAPVSDLRVAPVVSLGRMGLGVSLGF